MAELFDDIRSTIDVHALRRVIAGAVSAPGDADWDGARQAWNLAVEQRPAAVAMPASASDVVEIVRWARSSGLRVAPQGTGHNAAALGGDLEDSVLVKTERMRRVEIDPAARIARVEAGVLWLEVVEAAAEHGLAGLAGSSPDVGVVGYTVGGGVSWLGRKYGLGTNSVTAAELVTADGRFVRAAAETEPDLFWAIRGGGGNFGVVTALEFRLYPITDVYAGILWFPIERGIEVLHAWRELTQAGLPDELTTVGRYLQFPPMPDIPETVRGKSFAVVQAIYLGDAAAAEELLAPIRALGPAMDTMRVTPIQELSQLHMDPEHPVPGAGDGLLLAELPAEAVDTLVRVAGADSGSPLLSVEVRHLGGALGREPEGAGALAKLDAEYALYAVGVAATPQMRHAAQEHVGVLRRALEPWTARQMYMNFAESKRDGRSLWSDYAYRRLERIKARYDQAGVIRGNHELPAG